MSSVYSTQTNVKQLHISMDELHSVGHGGWSHTMANIWIGFDVPFKPQKNLLTFLQLVPQSIMETLGTKPLRHDRRSLILLETVEEQSTQDIKKHWFQRDRL